MGLHLDLKQIYLDNVVKKVSENWYVYDLWVGHQKVRVSGQ